MTLPVPGDASLLSLRLSYQAREIYELLYKTRDEPLTMQEIRGRLAHIGMQEQLDRRRRELNRYFVITKVGGGTEARYRLDSLKERADDIDFAISERDRAFVLRHGRCAMCGKTPLEHHVRLQVDHRVPKAWGGTDALENLQPLCEECNRGKKNLFSSLGDHEAAIRAAVGHDEVHKRIGEFLLATRGEWVRSDLVDLVASPPWDFQEDWQRRMRELRDLGWDYETRKRREDGRVRSYYLLTKSAPWPSGRVRAAISSAAKQQSP